MSQAQRTAVLPMDQDNTHLSLHHELLTHLPMFTQRWTDHLVLTFILTKTIRFGKPYEWLGPPDYQKGVHARLGAPGVPAGRQSIWRSRQRLTSEGLTAESSPRKSDGRVLTAPSHKFLRTYAQAVLVDGDRFTDLLTRYERMCDNQPLKFKEVDVGKFKTLEEALSEASRSSKAWHTRKREERLSKPPTVPGLVEEIRWVLKDMELDVTLKVTQKTRGQMKSWLAECHARDQSPYHYIEHVLRAWSSLNQTGIPGKFGPRNLGEFTWEKFYANREGVEEAIQAARRTSVEQEKIKTVDMRGGVA